MEIVILGYGSKVVFKGWVNTVTQMKHTQGCISTIVRTVEERKPSISWDICTKERLRMDSFKVRESNIMLTMITMWVSSIKVSVMVKESSGMQMVMNMMVNGLKTIKMDKEL